MAATSASNAWAVGSYLNSAGNDQPLIEHWNGSVWSVVPSPANFAQFTGVVATSASNAWAIGTPDFGAPPLIEQWNGHAWSVVPPPSFAGVGSLGGVTATSASNAWAVRGAGGKTLILHCC